MEVGLESIPVGGNSPECNMNGTSHLFTPLSRLEIGLRPAHDKHLFAALSSLAVAMSETLQLFK